MKNTKNLFAISIVLVIALFTANVNNCSQKRSTPQYGESYYTKEEKREMRGSQPAHMSNIYILGDKLEALELRVKSLEEKIRTQRK
jgi:hypothetical protein